MTLTDKKKLMKAFGEEAGFWIDVIGLKEWSTTIRMRYTGTGMLARCDYDCMAKDATIDLNELWLDGEADCHPDPNEHQSRKSAFHEVMELLLADLEDVCVNDPKNMERINTERHRIIRRLENVLFPLRGAINRSKVNK